MLKLFSLKQCKLLSYLQYGLAKQSFWIGVVEYVIRGVVSVGCDGVGGIVNGGDDEMGEESQHGRSNAVDNNNGR